MANYVHELPIENLDDFLGNYKVNPKFYQTSFNQRFQNGADQMIYSGRSEKRGSFYIVVEGHNNDVFQEASKVVLVNPRLTHGTFRSSAQDSTNDFYIHAESLKVAQ